MRKLPGASRRLGVGVLIAVAAALWASTSALASQTPTRLVAQPQLVTFPSQNQPQGVGVLHVSATLTILSSGTPLVGKQVSFTAAGTPLCSTSTGSNGAASCTLTSKLEEAILLPNEYSAEFAGDSTYAPSTGMTEAIELGTPPPPVLPPPVGKHHH